MIEVKTSYCYIYAHKDPFISVGQKKKLSFKTLQSLKKNVRFNTCKSLEITELRNKIPLKFNFLKAAVMKTM